MSYTKYIFIFCVLCLSLNYVSSVCIMGDNCPNGKGVCQADTCYCLRGYSTLLNKQDTNPIFCNYEQKSRWIAFFLEFIIPPIGLIYLGRFVHAFIKNNHVINEKYLKDEKEIKIKMNDGQKTIIKKVKIKNRFYYTNKEHDITIIEMKEEEKDDNSYEFLEFDDNMFDDDGSGYIGNSIYILHYPNHFEQDKVTVSFGILKGRDENKIFNFRHFCSTEFGSSGSPILNITNIKSLEFISKEEQKSLI